MSSSATLGSEFWKFGRSQLLLRLTVDGSREFVTGLKHYYKPTFIIRIERATLAKKKNYNIKNVYVRLEEKVSLSQGQLRVSK